MLPGRDLLVGLVNDGAGRYRDSQVAIRAAEGSGKVVQFFGDLAEVKGLGDVGDSLAHQCAELPVRNGDDLAFRVDQVGGENIGRMIPDTKNDGAVYRRIVPHRLTDRIHDAALVADEFGHTDGLRTGGGSHHQQGDEDGID